MKFILIGRGGLLTSTILREISEKGYRPAFVIIEHFKDTAYPNLTELECKRLCIKYILTDNPNAEECILKIKSFATDFVLVASLSTILKHEVLQSCDFYNVHMGVLPDYRGPYTNFWKIRNGDEVYGVSIHKMQEKIDSGVICLIKEKDFSDIINGFQFFRMNYLLAAKAVLEFFETYYPEGTFKSDLLPERIQEKGKYYGKFNDEDFEIDLQKECSYNYKFINRAQYYRSPFFVIEGKMYNVKSANLLYSYCGDKPTLNFKLDVIDANTVILYNDSGILEMKL